MFVFVRDAQQIHDDDDDDADAFGRWERKNNQDHSCWECDKLYKLQFEISKHSGICRMNQICFLPRLHPKTSQRFSMTPLATFSRHLRS